MKKCIKCNADISDSAETCPECGASQSSTAQGSDPKANETSSSVTTTEKVIPGKSNAGNIFLIILISIGVLIGGLYGYGYWKASDQLKKGQLSIFIAGVTIQGMNPISARGYRNYIMNKTDMPQRLKELDN